MFFLHTPCEGIPRWGDMTSQFPRWKATWWEPNPLWLQVSTSQFLVVWVASTMCLRECSCMFKVKCDAHAQTSFGWCLAVQQDSKMYVYVICLRRFRRVYTTTYPTKSRTVRRTSTSHRVEVRFFSASSSRCTQHHPWAALRSRTLSWQARLHTEYGQRKSCSIGSRLTLFRL